MSDTHEVRELRRRLKQANAVMGRQGRTIYDLHCQLAELREIHGKIERDEVRRLEREVNKLVDQTALDHERLERAQEEIQRLRDKLAAVEGESEDAGQRVP